MTYLAVLFMLLNIVEPASDLEKSAQMAVRDDVPILLYVSRSDCTFCRRFEQDVLGPLVASGHLDGKILVRELVWDKPQKLRDFKGRLVDPADLATSLNAKMTPTLLFLNSQGEEIVERITGYSSGEYFSYYFERAIDEAYRATTRELAE